MNAVVSVKGPSPPGVKPSTKMVTGTPPLTSTSRFSWTRRRLGYSSSRRSLVVPSPDAVRTYMPGFCRRSEHQAQGANVAGRSRRERADFAAQLPPVHVAAKRFGPAVVSAMLLARAAVGARHAMVTIGTQVVAQSRSSQSVKLLGVVLGAVGAALVRRGAVAGVAVAERRALAVERAGGRRPSCRRGRGTRTRVSGSRPPWCSRGRRGRRRCRACLASAQNAPTVVQSSVARSQYSEQ